MKNKYSQHILIPCYDTDAAQYLKAASFMDMAQEAANLHADILGFGYDRLQVTRTAWVLSRMHIHFFRHPKWKEEVDLTTWHKGPEKLFFLRDFLLTGQDGKPAVAATTSWLVVNIDTRRIVRDPGISTEDVCCEHAIEEPCGKVQVPADMQKEMAGTHTVSYSDVDMNGHTNNAMYILWAMDAVGYGTASTRRVKDIRVNFNRETRPGDTVSIYRAVRETADGLSFYIEGESDGHSAFCAELTF